MSNIAIIPARGGSKRIPRKNIKEFLGKPIIAYSIQAALESNLFEEVMVSTDNEEIAKVAKKYGASVPFMRSKKNADDYATLADVIDEVIGQYRSEGKSFDYGCCILPTTPLIQTPKIKEAYQLLCEKSFDTIKPIVPFSYPIQRALRYREGIVEMLNPEYAKSRSQDLEQAYHDAGQFYWFKFLSGLRGNRKGAIVIPEIEVQDIDVQEDWEIAELKFKLLYNQE